MKKLKGRQHMAPTPFNHFETTPTSGGDGNLRGSRSSRQHNEPTSPMHFEEVPTSGAMHGKGGLRGPRSQRNLEGQKTLAMPAPIATDVTPGLQKASPNRSWKKMKAAAGDGEGSPSDAI